MAISIRKAFKDVFSEKYDKKNTFLYIFLFILLGLPTIPFTKITTTKDIIALIIVSIPTILLSFGLCAYISNKAFLQSTERVPKLSQVFNLLFLGLRYIGTFLFISIVFYYLPTTLIAIGGRAIFTFLIDFQSNLIALVLLGILLILFIILLFIMSIALLYLIVVPMELSYFATLKFSEIFKFKERKEKFKKFYLSFFLKNKIVLPIIILVIFIAFNILFSTILGIIMIGNNGLTNSPTEMNNAIKILTTSKEYIIMSILFLIPTQIIGTYLTLLYCDLNGQILNSTNDEENEENEENEEDEEIEEEI